MTAIARLRSATPVERVDTLLGAAWVVMIGVTALGHVTALRNTLTVAVAALTLVRYRRSWRALVAWPALPMVAALALWAIASWGWSAAPAVTLSKLRTDLLIPLLAGAAAFCHARDGRGLRHVVGGLVLGLALLAALSAFAYLPPGWAPASWHFEQNGGIVQPLPHWYPGPGDASMFAIVALAPLAWALRARPRGRVQFATAVAGVVLLAFVLVTTNNRNAVLVAPLVLAFQWTLDRRLAIPDEHRAARVRRDWRRTAAIVLLTAAGLVLLAGVLEFGARQRFAYLHRPVTTDSAAVELVSSDTRPLIWRYYTERGLQHPWRGLGFGRTVPGIGWHTESDATLSAVEANAYIHAHNLFLNWWLQLGFVGLALLLGSGVAIVRASRRLVDAAHRSVAARHVDHALLAVLVAVVARNLTDDFLVYGMATVTFATIGALLGRLSGVAHRESGRRPGGD